MSGHLAAAIRDRHSDEGAVAVTTAISMLALISIAMLAIDGGSLWSSRRNLIADTDAAALAAVRVLANGDCVAGTSATAIAAASDIIVENDASVLEDGVPVVACVGLAGVATVAAIRPTNLTFGGLAGLPSVDVISTSIAQVGHVVTGTGLRPIALCNKDPHLLAFSRAKGYVTDAEILVMGGSDLLALVNQVEADTSEHSTSGPDGAYPAGSEVHRVRFSRTAVTSACGSAGGNWGWLDFDGGGGGSQQVRDWLRNGYDQPITVGIDEDCAPEVGNEDNCIGEPGAGGNSWSQALTDIYCPSNLTDAECNARGKAYPVILFDTVVCTSNGPNCGGNGANARYHPYAFLGVIIRDWSGVTGNPNDQSYFDLEFVDPFLTNGTISGTAPGDGPGVLAIQLCGGGFGTTIDDTCITLPTP